jgi:transposase
MAHVSPETRDSSWAGHGRLTSKIHAVVDGNGLPVRLALTAGEAHDNRLATRLLPRLMSGAMLLAEMPTGSEHLSASMARRRSSHRDGTEKTHSASARICIAVATWSSSSSTTSSSVGV